MRHLLFGIGALAGTALAIRFGPHATVIFLLLYGGFWFLSEEG